MLYRVTDWLLIKVKPASGTVFKALADPTRRSLFEQLCREGEQTVWMLTRHARISQSTRPFQLPIGFARN